MHVAQVNPTELTNDVQFHDCAESIDDLCTTTLSEEHRNRWRDLPFAEAVMSSEMYAELSVLPEVCAKPSPWVGHGVKLIDHPDLFGTADDLQQCNNYDSVYNYAEKLLDDTTKSHQIMLLTNFKIIIDDLAPALGPGIVIAKIARGAKSLLDIFDDTFRQRFQHELPEFLLADRLNPALVTEQYRTTRALYIKTRNELCQEAEEKFSSRMNTLPEDIEKVFQKLKLPTDPGWGKVTTATQNKHTRRFRVVPEVGPRDDIHFFSLACTAKHPFSMNLAPSEEYQKAAMISVLQDVVSIPIREAGMALVQEIRKFCEPYYSEVKAMRPFHAVRIGSKHEPLFIDVLARLMKWPDTELGWDIFWGMPIVGDIAACNVYPDNKEIELAKPRRDIMDGADSWHARVMLPYKPNVQDCVVRQKTCTELDRESAGPWTYERIKTILGNKFRAMTRFPAWSAGKWREVDDGKKSKHNASTKILERIDCEDVFTVDRFAKIQHYFWANLPTELRVPNLAIHGFTEDLQRAYRQVPVALDHLRYSVIAYRTRNTHHFVMLYALAFGLSSAVIQFNRVARFLSVACLTQLYVLNSNYYDDYVVTEKAETATLVKRWFSEFISLTGFFVDQDKGTQPAATLKWLGLMKDILVDRVRTFIGEERRTKILAEIEEIITNNWLSPGDAATLRGKLGFCAFAWFGRVGRGAMQALKARQYFENWNRRLKQIGTYRVTPWLLSSLHFLQALLYVAPERETFYFDVERPLWIIFTDASAEAKSKRRNKKRKHVKGWTGKGKQVILNDVQLGWVIHPPEGPDFGGKTKISDDTLEYWKKKQPIALAEMLAVFQAILTTQIPTGSDVMIFLDNTVGHAAFVKGSCRDEFGDDLASAFHLWCAQKDIRCWFEWVPTKLNIADKPSRSEDIPGINCPWVDLHEALAVDTTMQSDFMQLYSRQVQHLTAERNKPELYREPATLKRTIGHLKPVNESAQYKRARQGKEAEKKKLKPKPCKVKPKTRLVCITNKDIGVDNEVREVVDRSYVIDDYGVDWLGCAPPPGAKVIKQSELSAAKAQEMTKTPQLKRDVLPESTELTGKHRKHIDNLLRFRQGRDKSEYVRSLVSLCRHTDHVDKDGALRNTVLCPELGDAQALESILTASKGRLVKHPLGGIVAVQGHSRSTRWDKYHLVQPFCLSDSVRLFHWTSTNRLCKIKQEGLSRMDRMFIHLMVVQPEDITAEGLPPRLGKRKRPRFEPIEIKWKDLRRKNIQILSPADFCNTKHNIAFTVGSEEGIIKPEFLVFL